MSDQREQIAAQDTPTHRQLCESQSLSLAS
jgi:hypothetical protein